MSVGEDRLRELANHTAKFRGDCLPTFFRWENLCALGVKPDKIIPEMFSDDAAYSHVIDECVNKISKKKKSTIDLEVKGAYMVRSNLCDRVPESWPVHPVLSSFLAARREYKHEQGARPKAFKDQLALLSACEGWQPIRENDKINKNFIDGLQAVMQLHYFGISMAEVLYPFPSN